jgi:replicative DNA helicase
VGGQARIAQLVDRTISAANIDQYAALVMDKYTRRLLIQSGGDIVPSWVMTLQRPFRKCA